MAAVAAAHRPNLGQLRILQSASRDIFSNLAIEDALFRRQQEQTACAKSDCVLLIYRNSPCVVVGLHQNPWLECRVRPAEKSAVSVARRLSGGGAVYHDLGNWNLSLITPTAYHKREANSEMIRRLCSRLAGPDKQLTVGKRFDIFSNEFKVSGSAAKLARGAAYHHFCLLLSSNLNHLSTYLGSSLPAEIVTNATASVRSPVANLTDLASSEILLDALTEVLESAASFGHPIGSADSIHVGSQTLTVDNISNEFPELLPTSVKQTADRLRTWDWVFGRTPTFLCRLPAPCDLTLTIEKGHITAITDGSAANLASQLSSLLIGQACRASTLLPFVDQFEGSASSLVSAEIVAQLRELFVEFGN